MSGSKRGGVRPNAGPKPLSPTGEKMKNRAIRMTDEEWQKCLRLGGGPWIRDRIRRAKEPVHVDHIKPLNGEESAMDTNGNTNISFPDDKENHW